MPADKLCKVIPIKDINSKKYISLGINDRKILHVSYYDDSIDDLIWIPISKLASDVQIRILHS